MKINTYDYAVLNEKKEFLKDIPRAFDEELYRNLGVSISVIDYWRTMDFIPHYYHLFWLLMRRKKQITYDEYKSMRDRIVEMLPSENAEIGQLANHYKEAEQNAFEWFITSDENHIFYLLDDCGSASYATTDYNMLMQKMKKSDNSHDNYAVVRYAINRANGHFSMNLDRFRLESKSCCGGTKYNKQGNMKPFIKMNNFDISDKMWKDLVSQYLVLPHPFRDRSYVKYVPKCRLRDDEYYYGIICSGLSDLYEDIELPNLGLTEEDSVIKVKRIDIDFISHKPSLDSFPYRTLPYYLESLDDEDDYMKEILDKFVDKV